MISALKSHRCILPTRRRTGIEHAIHVLLFDSRVELDGLCRPQVVLILVVLVAISAVTLTCALVVRVGAVHRGELALAHIPLPNLALAIVASADLALANVA